MGGWVGVEEDVVGGAGRPGVRRVREVMVVSLPQN